MIKRTQKNYDTLKVESRRKNTSQNKIKQFSQPHFDYISRFTSLWLSQSLFFFQPLEFTMTCVNSISASASPGLQNDTGAESSNLRSISPISQCLSFDIGDCVNPNFFALPMKHSSHHESSTNKSLNVVQLLQTELTKL